MTDLFDRKYIRSVIVSNVSYFFENDRQFQTKKSTIFLSLRVISWLNDLWNDPQIGVGLMFFQQFGGINGVSFYVSETFAAAGKHVVVRTMLVCLKLPKSQKNFTEKSPSQLKIRDKNLNFFSVNTLKILITLIVHICRDIRECWNYSLCNNSGF